MKNKDVFIKYFKSLNLEIKEELNESIYDHVGAFIVDSILQSGLNYNNVVYPRVLIVLEKYKTFSSTEKFHELINMVGVEQVTNLKNKRKNKLIIKISEMFLNDNVNSVKDIKKWIRKKENIIRLLSLHGVGFKTVDYMKKLAGIDCAPIDRHLLRFIEKAGIKEKDYIKVKKLYEELSFELNISLSSIDKTIWRYMVQLDKV